MEEVIKLGVSLVAVLLSLASFVIARRSAMKAKRAETISHLLGSKETVAFAALKVLRDGLPKSAKDRQLLIASLVQAAVFTSSDRARALLYRVVELNRDQYREDLRTASASLSSTFDSMDAYSFADEDLNLGRGRRRLAALSRVIDAS